MKKEFALDPGGPKRLTVTYPWNMVNAEVLFDGQKVASFATKDDFRRGTTLKLLDGSVLSVRFDWITGAPFMKGIHVIRNGVPIPGSAADPVPRWTWPFMIACILIPVVSLGGAIPATIAALGVTGMLPVSRATRWSVAMRALACAMIVVLCWGAFGVMIVSFQGTEKMSTLFMSSSPEKLLAEIEATYTKQGFKPDNISKMMDQFRYECYHMDKKACVDFLRTDLQKIKNAHYSD